MESKRNTTIDAIKGISIILVVWGHFIEAFIIPRGTWNDNSIHTFIYSFHMPLFVFLAGLFAYGCLNKPFLIVAKQKFMKLLLPACIFYFIDVLQIKIFNFAGLYHPIDNLVIFYWFLKLIFCCYLIFYITEKYLFKLHFLIILLLLTADKYVWYYLFFFYPFFILGYILRRCMQKKISMKYSKTYYILGMMSIIVYFFLLKDFSWNCCIYNIPRGLVLYPLNVNIELFKSLCFLFAVSLSGVMSIFFLSTPYTHSTHSSIYKTFKKLKFILIVKDTLTFIGKYTLQIYLCHILFVHNALIKEYLYINNSFVLFLLSAIVSYVIAIICSRIETFKYYKLVFNK